VGTVEDGALAHEHGEVFGGHALGEAREMPALHEVAILAPVVLRRSRRKRGPVGDVGAGRQRRHAQRAMNVEMHEPRAVMGVIDRHRHEYGGGSARVGRTDDAVPWEYVVVHARIDLAIADAPHGNGTKTEVGTFVFEPRVLVHQHVLLLAAATYLYLGLVQVAHVR